MDHDGTPIIRRTSRGFRTAYARAAARDDSEPAPNATVSRRITLHHGPNGKELLEPGTRVLVLEHDDAGLYRLAIDGSPRGVLVDEEKIRLDRGASFEACSPTSNGNGSGPRSTDVDGPSSSSPRREPDGTPSPTTHEEPDADIDSSSSLADSLETLNELEIESP